MRPPGRGRFLPGGAPGLARALTVRAPRAAVALLSVVLVGCSSSGPGNAGHDSAEAYVATMAYDDEPGTTLDTVDLATGSVGPAIGVDTPSVLTGQAATEPAGLAVTPDGREVLVTARAADELAIVDTSDNRVVSTVASEGDEPVAVAVTPDGSTALVANFDSGTVTPIALGSGHGVPTAGTPIPVGDEPDAIAVTPDGSTALVADFGSNTVTPIALGSTSPNGPSAWSAQPAISLGTTGAAPTGLVASSSGDTVWVTAGGAVFSVDATTGAVTMVASTGQPLEAIALEGSAGPSGAQSAWVATQNGKLARVDLTTGAVGRFVAVGGRPSAMVIAG